MQISGFRATWALLAYLCAPGAMAVQTVAFYDAAQDRVAVTATDTPVSEVLSQIGAQSGLEVLFDPAADRRLTIEFKAMPLDQAMDRVTQGLNVIKRYGRSTDRAAGGKSRPAGKPGQDKPVLVGVTVLPQGKTDASAALRLLAADKELELRAAQVSRFEARAAGDATRVNRLLDRWQARVGSLPASQRAAYEKRLEQMREAQARRLEASQKQAAGRELDAAARERQAAEVAKKRGDPAQHPRRPYDADTAARAQAEFGIPDTPAVVPEKQ